MRFPYWFTGAEGAHFLDSHHDSSPNGDSLKFSSQKYDHHDSWEMREEQKFSATARLGIVSPNYRQTTSLSSSINALVGSVRSSSIQQQGSHWRCRSCFKEVTNRWHQCHTDSIKEPNQNHQMTYHNMFTPSQEPGTLWRCRRCGKEVTNRWHHFHSHTAQRSMCPYCPATYSRIDTLRSHLKQKHKNQA